MLQLEGRYCRDCKIFTDNVEDEAVALIQSMLDYPAFANSHIRIMPDVHMGKGITIGFSAPLGEYVNPNHVGVDIGCTVSCMELSSVIPSERYAEFERLVHFYVAIVSKITCQNTSGSYRCNVIGIYGTLRLYLWDTGTKCTVVWLRKRG